MSFKKTITAGFALAAALGAGAAVSLQVQDRPTPLSACLASRTPDAAGAPVIVIPGFMTNDAYMSRLQARFREQGYRVYGWNAGLNSGADAGKYAKLQQQLDRAYAAQGRKVTLVGYSLGGVYARELSRANPAKVARVITLAAPFGLQSAKGGPDEAVARLYQIAQGKGKAPQMAEVLAPPPVPTVSFYSRADRVVPWQASQSAPGPQSQNIEIRPGHLAMPFNREVASMVVFAASPAYRAGAAVLPCRPVSPSR